MTNERAYTPSLVLHVLRNPHGWSAEAITAARLQAADEIERLHKDLRRANAALVRHGVQTDPAMNTHPSDEPCEQRNEVNSIDDVAAICHSVTGLCCHILGSPGGPCTIGNCAAVRGYLGGPEFAQDNEQPVAAPGATQKSEDSATDESSRPRELLASEAASFHKTLARSPRRIIPARDADHCDYPDCEQHWTHVVAQARALLEPLAEHDPAIRQWLKTPDLPKLQGASRDASSGQLPGNCPIRVTYAGGSARCTREAGHSGSCLF